MRYAIYLLLAFALFASCNKNLHPSAGVIPYNPLTFERDSTEAAKFNIELSKINDDFVAVTSKKGGNVNIKNSFNDNSKDKSKIKAENVATEGATAILDQGSVKDKSRIKDVGNDYSKVKDAGNYTDKSTLKDKSKAKEKVKDSIQGDGNSQQKSEGVPPLLIYLSIGVVFLIVLLFLGWPKIKKFFPF